MIEPTPSRPVIKVGGSVLRNGADYRTVADRLRPWIDRGTWVVVSAARGVTNELERLSAERRAGAVPGIVARHARWAGTSLPERLARELRRAVADGTTPSATIISWGERASAAVLQAHLARAGAPLPIVELPSHGAPAARAPAIVPGYYVRDGLGRVRLLPRGGSDISAVLLADRLHAPEVRLWKDGGGLRGDPGGPSILPEVEGVELLERLEGQIRPLHPDAVRLALRAGVDIVLEDPFGRYASTRILSRPAARRELPLPLSHPEARRVEAVLSVPERRR